MQDYMKALRDRFVPEKTSDEKAELEEIRGSLTSSLEKRQQRQLLDLIDLNDHWTAAEALRNFIAGFKLGIGIMTELQLAGVYSFEAEDETNIRRYMAEEAIANGKATSQRGR